MYFLFQARKLPIDSRWFAFISKLFEHFSKMIFPEMLSTKYLLCACELNELVAENLDPQFLLKIIIMQIDFCAFILKKFRIASKQR